ncbi:NADP-dependent oxidoreductase domain-containing protein [Mycena albidolilacea]|uniref:NADP-dependent oxidoreductase domain-containing protein n=1 Tax=Mycena albidolilacea TaxID=1033008 RepID=A0AAD7APP0_9AGAR|nr:NADP-dependent oxidoreductase domain-containing protein [Mycena albidolilacea]
MAAVTHPPPAVPTTMTPAHETFQLGPFTAPRLWTGLWQLSSNAWGTASVSKIRQAMGRHVERGYTAFDMADHYGSAELIFGKFRASLESPNSVLGATKYCVFKPIPISRETVEAAVRQRMERMRTTQIDLLQFHWQDYELKQDYILTVDILNQLKGEGLIAAIGLCNFDSLRTDEICTQFPGVIVSNQVQFSLIDTRPLYGMADICTKHGIKLLTYGTLCGGFLADKWIGEPEPDPYSGSLNPSQRKYLDMIIKAWHSWTLFQELLCVLRDIGARHDGLSVSNVATRWVLDHAVVGAVIIGARLGCSEYPDDNAKVFSVSLTDEDRRYIDDVLTRSNGSRLIRTIGDCGGEYRC